MPDNKLTDNEIMKAQKYCCEADSCDRGCPLVDKCESPIKTMEEFIKFDLDLINRLQAKAIKEQNKNSKLRNERNRLQAQNKDLAETVHNLTIEKDALFDKAEELKVEVERLKTNLNVELENFATEYDNKIKAEAYKEFAERLNKIEKFRSCVESDNYELSVTMREVDNLLKELVGEDK